MENKNNNKTTDTPQRVNGDVLLLCHVWSVRTLCSC